MADANSLPPELHALFQRRQLGAHFSLKAMEMLCARLGNPERNLRFIHIAGTNGKGSVAAMCAAILQETGLRVGLYTSPHLIRYNERFRANGVDISDDELMPLLRELMREAPQATFFELSTALALKWFCQRSMEVVIWETGLGGRLDATNVVDPSVSVLTHIGMDHMQLLGNSLAEIAREKAGIIKSGRPAITQEQEPEVMKVFEARAQEMDSPLSLVTRAELDEFPSPLAGAHQRWNTSLAVSACRAFYPSLSSPSIQDGLARTRWPARCQLFKFRGLPLLIDGAHNLLGMEALKEEVFRRWGRQNVSLIFGVLSDKSLQGVSARTGAMARHIFIVPVQSERSAKTRELLREIANSQECEGLPQALDSAVEKGLPMVIAGSLFLAGEALQLLSGENLGLHPNERLLPKP